MKTKWTGYLGVLAIIAVITLSGVKVQNYLDRTASEMVASLQAVKDDVAENKWEDSIINFSTFIERWQPVRENWVLFINHNEINNVETKLTRISELLKTQEHSSVTAELGEAIMLLQQIPERERLNWRNIF